MKKFSSMLALALAMALTLGMTVSAAGSTSTETTDITNKVEVADSSVQEKVETVVELPASLDAKQETALKAEAETQKAAMGTVTTTNELKAKLPEGAVATVTTKPVEAKVQAVAKNAVEKLVSQLTSITVAAGKSVAEATTIKASADISLDITGADKAAILADGGVKLALPIKVTPVAGKAYLVAHMYAEGKWETVPATVTEDGTIIATFTSLSPVYVVEIDVEKDGEGGDDSNGVGSGATDTQSSAAAAETAVSPKTGETLPVAGIMAVICLAGLAVCAAKKVKFYN